jgi:hypothetical protein
MESSFLQSRMWTVKSPELYVTDWKMKSVARQALKRVGIKFPDRHSHWEETGQW